MSSNPAKAIFGDGEENDVKYGLPLFVYFCSLEKTIQFLLQLNVRRFMQYLALGFKLTASP